MIFDMTNKRLIFPIMYGYRLVEWFMDAELPEEKVLQIDTLQKIYEMGNCK